LENLECSRSDCANWKKNGRCALTDPELHDESCLYFEDVITSLRLKADSVKGILNREETNPYKISQITNKQKKLIELKLEPKLFVLSFKH